MVRPVISFTLLLGAALLGGACHHNVPQTLRTPATPPPTPAPAARSAARASAPTPPAPARAPAPLSEDELFHQKSLDQLNAERPLSDVFFDYDQNVLRDEARAALQRDAQWLSRWSQTRLVIEGHCDERGTAEYNLALGDRRADIVRDYLVALGIPASRLVTKSLGKEAPFCNGSGESCWSQNRRGHFVITAK